MVFAPPLIRPPGSVLWRFRVAAVSVGVYGLLALNLAFANDLEERRTRLDHQFQRNLDRLATRCRQLGLPVQAAVTDSWSVDRYPRRQYLFLVPETDPTLPAQNAPQLVRQWHQKFTQRRREHAASLFELAGDAIGAGHATMAYQLLHEVLHEYPDHDQARQALGFRRAVSDWRTTAQGIRRRPVRSTHPQFGWSRGEYWRVESEHFRITTSHSPAAGIQLAEELEEFYGLWQQLFFRYWSTKEALARRLAGVNAILGPERKHQVVQFRDRQEYLTQLTSVEPRISVSLGYYMHGRRTSFFYAGDGSLRATWFHEVAHQLFQETGKSIDDVGSRWNFWIVEGIAVYLESLVPHQGYWTVGGFDVDRLQYARVRTLKGGTYTPLRDLVRLGRDALQLDREIRRLYTQSAGLTHFLMDGNGSQFRDPTIGLLGAVYLGRDTIRSLAVLTDTDFDRLDEMYKEFLNVQDEALPHLSQAGSIRNLALGRSAVTDRGLRHLANCRRLEWLDVSFTRVTDEGLEPLRNLTNLKQLSLEHTAITDAALDVVAGFRKLEELDLSGTAVTNDGVTKLAGLRHLKTLWLTDTEVTDRVLVTLKQLPHLERADVSGTGVTKAAWSQFRQHLDRDQ